MDFKDIRWEVDADGIGRLTINKPEKLNALSWGTWSEIENAIALADEDDEVRCVVITGEGRGFSAGTDLTGQGEESQWMPRPHRGRKGRNRTRFLGASDVYHCSKPTIAAVNGAAVGAGFSLALACDIRIAAESARFSAIFTKRAVVADTGSTWFLTRLIGPARALEMVYTGRMVGAQEALAMGLVNETVPNETLMDRVNALAHAVAHGPAIAIEIDKQLVQTAFDRSLDDQIELEQSLQRFSLASEDAAEGRRSFLEKRDPVFRGR